MSKVFQIVGDELVNKDGTTAKLQSFLGQDKVLGVYFSGHWCSPCRSFTPKLAEFYKNVKESGNADNFEIVFVSSDKTEDDFKGYLSDMPWWGMPFQRRDEKNQLSKYFKVDGIPTFLLLDGLSGKVLNKNGRSIVVADPKGEKFPWKAKKLHDILQGGDYINNNDEKKTFEKDIKGNVLGVYFSAHWCPPCKAFTPLLCKTYNLVNKEKKKFEIIFVSSDRDDGSFKKYFKTMPFLALPFDSAVKNAELSEFYEVEGIPMLIIVDENGEIITTNGRAVISGDKEANKFPWTPEPVEELDEVSAAKLNEYSCLIFLPGEDAEEFAKMKDILKPLGEESQRAAKSEERSPDLNFLVANPAGNDVVNSLCDFIHVDPKEKSLFILDISSLKIFKAEQAEYTSEVVGQFVKDYRDGKLTATVLRD